MIHAMLQTCVCSVPDWLVPILRRLYEETKLFPEVPNHVLVSPTTLSVCTPQRFKLYGLIFVIIFIDFTWICRVGYWRVSQSEVRFVVGIGLTKVDSLIDQLRCYVAHCAAIEEFMHDMQVNEYKQGEGILVSTLMNCDGMKTILACAESAVFLQVNIWTLVQSRFLISMTQVFLKDRSWKTCSWNGMERFPGPCNTTSKQRVPHSTQCGPEYQAHAATFMRYDGATNHQKPQSMKCMKSGRNLCD